MSPTFRLVLEYDGARFAGWQTQAEGARTIQAAVEEAILQVTGAGVAVVGASRTDAGVHAEGQVASVGLETRLAPAALVRALNALLPEDVAVRDVALAPEGFHAQRDARSKLYRYAIWNGPERSPLRAHRFWAVPRALDLGAMETAAAALVGTHDWSAFQVRGSEWRAEGEAQGRTRSAVRQVTRLSVLGFGGGEVQVEVEGEGFLRQMVRTLVGTLVEVGRGRRDPSSMPALLESRDRAAAGPTAPAHGLTLVRVDYALSGLREAGESPAKSAR
ncbi:MAG TPA: tRNA pseudouridine(38-40) synthase TruA [Myxococcota bacterium]|nr:tRNA pseudouridine(38-40) synthase TruA [Myxococcota bacterium]